MRKKILIYNWIPFTDERRGGGVRVYLKNLVDYIINSNIEIDLTFLCAGVYCDDKNPEIRYEKISTYGNGKCDIYAIINSPIFAPAWITFCRTNDVLCDQSTRIVFEDFIEKEGPFDVIHFHNIEGLSINVLDSKQKYPNTRFVLSLHNYYCFCPEVNLWKEKACINCIEEDTGEKCIDCMVTHVPAEKLRKKLTLTYGLMKEDTPERRDEFDKIARHIDEEYRKEEERKLKGSETNEIIDALKKYRKTVVKKINDNIDTVLCVSNRVNELSVRMGINSQIVRTSYIGTLAAENQITKKITAKQGDNISIIFIGYQRKEKGFYFLIDSLNALDERVAQKIDLTIAALGNNDTFKQWNLNYGKFHSYSFQNGYTKDEEKQLLLGNDLGIVPVLWEDNLPQVAIEMAAFGVPVLSSTLGGAHELSSDNRFVFKAGDISDFCEKITYFVNNPEELPSYFDAFMGLRTMKQHVNELTKIYNCED